MMKKEVANTKKESIKKFGTVGGMKHRKIHLPKKPNVKRHIKSFSNEYSSKLYNDLSLPFIVWIYIRSLMVKFIPAFFVHGMLSVVLLASYIATPDVFVIPPDAIILIVIVYAICLYFGIRRAKDHLALYKMYLVVDKYNINREYLSLLTQTLDPANDERLSLLNHYRKKINKDLLFPTKRDIALKEQLYRNSDNNTRKSNIYTRKEALRRATYLNIIEKNAEHKAAKEIAKILENEYGGPNEYNGLVEKYKNRTVEEVKQNFA